MSSYPYLQERVVIVDGPAASGVYDLNQGVFARVTHDAANFLRSLTGVKAISDFAQDAAEFVQEGIDRGLIALQSTDIPRKQTELNEVLRPVRPVRFAWVELTSKCNQLCKHCFLGHDLNRYRHMPIETIEQTIDALAMAGVRQLILSGGEPLSHPDFEKILDYAGTNYDFKISLLTNGSHGRINSLIDKFRLYEVTVKIPLLGWGESHDKMAGIEGGFDRTQRSIIRLIDAGVAVELGTTVTGLNHMDIPAIRQFANELGVPLEVSPLYKTGYAAMNSDELYSIPQETIVKVCQEDKSTPRPAYRSAYPRPSRMTPDPTDYEAVDLRDYLTEHSECGQKILAVLSDGNVTPCLMLRGEEFSLGNVHEEPLSKILSHTTDRAAKFDSMMSLAAVPGCSECEARYVCKAGGCPASAKAFAGSVTVKNPLYTRCYYTNRQMRAEVGLEDALPQ